MSLLSATQGRPERVFSLLDLLHAHSGRLARGEVFEWLAPTFEAGDGASSGVPGGKKAKQTAVEQIISAARSLGFVADGSDPIVLLPPADVAPSSLEALADSVHHRLADAPADDSDYPLLEVYAWFVVKTAQQQGTGWPPSDLTVGHLADQIASELRPNRVDTGEDRIFNSTKLSPWRDWMTFLGLGWTGPSLPHFYPDATIRLGRELRRPSLPLKSGVDLDAQDVVAALATAMPYLDGGLLFRAVASTLGWTPPVNQLSPVLSTALRELHDDGVIRLQGRGDAKKALMLTTDRLHKISFIESIRIVATEAS